MPKKTKRNNLENNNLRDDTIAKFEKFSIFPDMDLGQNFLIDDEILEKISYLAQPDKNDLIIEIGPGLGCLTDKLFEKSGRLVLIEYDFKLASILEKQYENYDNVIVINEDALQTDYKELIEKYSTGEKYNIKIVSNLPYYITTEIITKLICNLDNVSLMVFTIQKEAAEKISAKPGSKNYSVISALAGYYFEPEIAREVMPESFIPKPKVTSSIIKLKKINDQKIADITKSEYLKVLKASFSQRRKTLANSLGSSGIVSGGKSTVEKILSDIGLSTNVRAQEIGPKYYEKIAKIILNK